MIGALDGLPPEEIDALTSAGRTSGYPLLTRMADGRTITVDRSHLVPFVERAAARLAEEHPALMVLLCAGDFPLQDRPTPLLMPGVLLPGVVRALTRNREIGVVTPVAGQVEAARAKWEAHGFSPCVTWASPYDPSEIDRAAGALADSSVELIVLDCMGHGRDYRRTFVRRSGRPVILAQTVIARIAGELLEVD